MTGDQGSAGGEVHVGSLGRELGPQQREPWEGQNCAPAAPEPPSSGRGREELQKNHRKRKRGITVRSWRPWGRFHVQGKALAARVGSSPSRTRTGQDGGREGGGVVAVLNRILPQAEAGQ